MLENIKINTGLMGIIKPNWDNKNDHFKYRISITYNGIRTSFVYYTSVMDYRENKRKLTKHDKSFSLQCFINDCLICCDYDIEEFLIEFGHTGNSTELKQGFTAFKECKKSLKKALKLFTEDELYQLSTEIYKLEL